MGTLTNENVFVKFIDFPVKGNETVTRNEDDTYTVFINSRLSREMQLKAYMHALVHIQNGDFDKTDVDQIEYTAHNVKTSIDFA